MPVVLIHLSDYLWWGLAAGLILLGLLLVLLCVARLVDMGRARRRHRLELRYRPIVATLSDPSSAGATLATLARIPRLHRAVVGTLLLSTLRVTAGDVVDGIHAGAVALGLDRRWRRGLESRRWWERADSATALGLLRQRDSSAAIVALLDDPHEQVRAAAVTALGWLADEATIAPLLTRLADETRHQRVRIIEAFQHFGQEVGPPLVAYATAHAEVIPLIADVVGQLRVVSAADQLIEWTSHTDVAVRVAALRALGTMGLNDRSFYYAVRALGDEHPDARAMAARALGRARRLEAASYLETCLEDDWTVAAEAATALHRLGAHGAAALQRATGREGQAGDLARQMLWESRPVPAAAA